MVGYRTFALTLRLHDYLWFASLEWGNDNETAPVIHAYALSFALSGHGRTFDEGGVPTYEDDLAAIDLYATPARVLTTPKRGARSSFTFNSIDDPSQLTEIKWHAAGKSNDPKFGKRQVLNPGLLFECVVFTKHDAPIPRVFRLGKKRSPVVVESRVELRGKPFEGQGVPSHAVNPRDVTGRVTECIPLSIPPHMVYERAAIEDDTFLRQGATLVHVPRRVREWLALETVTP